MNYFPNIVNDFGIIILLICICLGYTGRPYYTFLASGPPPRSIFNTVNMSTSGICIWISSIGIDMQINMPIMMDERAREANQSTVGIQGRGWCYAKICGSRKDNANKQYWWGIKEIKFPSPTWRDCLIRLSLLAAAPICSLILIYV